MPEHSTKVHATFRKPNDNRPFLEVNVLGIKLIGLLDSGATRTCVGTEGIQICKRLGLKLKPVALTSCRTASGQEMNTIGVFSVLFEIKGVLILVNVLAIPFLFNALILGADFWREANLIVDLARDQFTFSRRPPMISSVAAKSDLTQEQRERLEHTLSRIFSGSKQTLGCTNLVEHRIRTTAEPIRQRYYPLSPALQAQVNRELDLMLEQGIVEPSSSPWASPIVLVRKPDNTYRFCVDFRKVNKVTERDAYPLPYVSSILDKLGRARYLTSLDIKSAYWQVPMAEESKPITAFIVPNRGLFQFTRMPFGLHNAPATWQRLIDRVLGVDLDQYVFVYLDDIIIVSEDFNKHLEVLSEVLRRLQSAGLSVSPEKCQICRPELKYLGYVVDDQGLHVDPEKVRAILDMPIPTSVKEVRRVMGMASWYRRFVPNFSTLVAPINTLLRKGIPFEWTSKCDTAYQILKQHLISAPVMSCPNFDKPFTIQTDASDYGLGAVLTQNFEDGEHVISYISRSLSPNERKFSATEKECLAVVWAIEKFRPYVEASHFTVITDHFALQWLQNLKDPCGRLSRWSVRLQQYSFEVVHRRGREHVLPDALSRSVPKLEASFNDILFPDIKDPWYQKMCQQVINSPLSYPNWRLQDRTLYKRCRNSTGTINRSYVWRIVVPKNYRFKMLMQYHDEPTAGHGGVYKTFARIAEKFYWPKMRADISQYVRRCQVCLAQKPEQKAPAGLMCDPINVTQPWEVISIDLTGPFPKSTSGFRYILSIQDYFSKFCIFLPLRSATANLIVKRLEENVYLLFGTPRMIICDNGTQFTSSQFRKLNEVYGVQIRFNAVYHPQANPIERSHRTLKVMLSSYVRENHRSWESHLQKLACAMRTSTHETISATPYFVNFGRQMCINGKDFELVKQLKDPNDTPPVPRSTTFREIYDKVRTRLQKASAQAKRTYDLRRRNVQYNIGDRVWCRNYVLSDASKNFMAKLAPKFKGPFVITRRTSPWTYELKDPITNKTIGIWHVKDLKPDTST